MEFPKNGISVERCLTRTPLKPQFVKFPFSISRTILFKQSERKITSEGYFLNQIEDQLENLGMTIMRCGNDELFLRKTDFLRAMRKQDFLRNLRVKVQTDNSTIRITLTTETILVFVFGLLPYALLLVPNQNFPITFPIIASTFFWGVGFVSKFLIIRELKSEIERHLKKINDL